MQYSKNILQFKIDFSTILSIVARVSCNKSRGFEKKVMSVQTDAIKYFNIPSILKLLLKLLKV